MHTLAHTPCKAVEEDSRPPAGAFSATHSVCLLTALHHHSLFFQLSISSFSALNTSCSLSNVHLVLFHILLRRLVLLSSLLHGILTYTRVYTHVWPHEGGIHLLPHTTTQTGSSRTPSANRPTHAVLRRPHWPSHHHIHPMTYVGPQDRVPRDTHESTQHPSHSLPPSLTQPYDCPRITRWWSASRSASRNSWCRRGRTSSTSCRLASTLLSDSSVRSVSSS